MPYTIEEMTANALPSAAPTQMRQERVLSPYEAKPQLKFNPKTQPQNVRLGDQPRIHGTGEGAVPTDAPAEQVTLSPAAAALARKEQRFRREEAELRAKTAELEKEKAELAEARALKTKLDAKDYNGIEKFLPYDDYTNYLIEKDAALDPQTAALQKVQSEIDAVKKTQQDDISKRFDAAVAERKAAVASLVEANPEFSAIKELKRQDAVVQHILDTWEHDSVNLSVEQAAKEVEQLLIEEANVWAKLSKLTQQQAPSAESAAPVTSTRELPPLKPKVQTLTNNMNATGETKRPVKSFHGMSDQERYAEARRRVQERQAQGR